LHNLYGLNDASKFSLSCSAFVTKSRAFVAKSGKEPAQKASVKKKFRA
tara:strand:- start:63954 stop:64097 length:144 start_codon:yes stop_codon:yes gene_type:complete